MSRPRPVTQVPSRGFTLIEILIVVVILGILAAIIVPKFADATQDASMSAAQSQLQTLRNQIEMHRVRNDGARPVDFRELVDEGYIRSMPAWPAGFVATYPDADGDLTLAWGDAVALAPDADGNGTPGEASDVAAIAAW